jgi:hypothetical protein
VENQMSIADKLGFGPKRDELPTTDGGALIMVAPHPFSGVTIKQTVPLDADQYRRYRQWRAGGVLLQDALTDLSPSQREILMSGIGEDASFADDDEQELP